MLNVMRDDEGFFNIIFTILEILISFSGLIGFLMVLLLDEEYEGFKILITLCMLLRLKLGNWHFFWGFNIWIKSVEETNGSHSLDVVMHL